MAEESAPATTAIPLSFSFSRVAPRKKLPVADGGEITDGKEWVRGVEDSQVLSVNPKEAPKELVIPLIQKNRWSKIEHPLQAKTKKGEQEERPEDGVLSQAVKELIEESKRSQDRWENGEKVDLNMTIPLLMQNRVPDGFEDGDKVDVSLRPESATDVDYDVVPVEAYGMAMLRGMGWKQGEGIGRTFKQDVKPLEHQLRPKGLGLGADRSAVKDLEPNKYRRPPKPGEERQEEETGELVTGALVQIETGAHKELYGKVEGVDPDNARAMVKLAIGGKVVTVTQYSLRLVSKKEFEKNSKDLSLLSKAHKAEEQRKEEEKRNELKTYSQMVIKDHNHSEKSDKKRKTQKDSDRDSPMMKQSKSSDGICNTSSSRSTHWLQRDLRVRFIDKQYKGGKYYNCKMRIEDVLSPELCVCRTEDGRVLDGITQSMLETLIPKAEEDFVMVVLGSHSGQVGRILRKDKEKSRALVQLLRDEVNVLKLDFDAICHYVGETQD
ncbi:G-patch domain and KOW motifs-containing protein [Ambystoma mexicanum]|uniref:G-patch domain and KOW motifs-containing protein n=1 Tax=Ambystoma mexicanum TaxID=8296 RepID=UPI0037E9648B